MNLYEEKILKEMKNLNDIDLLTNVDIERSVDKLLLHYKERIKKLEKECKAQT